MQSYLVVSRQRHFSTYAIYETKLSGRDALRRQMRRYLVCSHRWFTCTQCIAWLGRKFPINRERQRQSTRDLAFSFHAYLFVSVEVCLNMTIVSGRLSLFGYRRPSSHERVNKCGPSANKRARTTFLRYLQ